MTAVHEQPGLVGKSQAATRSQPSVWQTCKHGGIRLLPHRIYVGDTLCDALMISGADNRYMLHLPCQARAMILAVPLPMHPVKSVQGVN